MGIRYYAYPLRPESIPAARLDPATYLSSDPLADAWELNGRRRPSMLYLDKSWRLLQELTCADPDAPRPSHALVAGHVTQTGGGWIPCVDVLDEAAVRAVADDLATIDSADLDELFGDGRSGYRGDDRRYLESDLAQAQEFTADLRERSLGLIYMIG